MGFEERLKQKLERTEIEYLRERVLALVERADRVEILKEQPTMSCKEPSKSVIYKNDMQFENRIILNLCIHLPKNSRPNELVKLKEGGEVRNEEDWELVD